MKERKYIYEIKKSSPPDPLCQFQRNLAQSILGWMGFKFVEIKDHTSFQGEIILNTNEILLSYLVIYQRCIPTRIIKFMFTLEFMFSI